jgi:hypothetical protein
MSADHWWETGYPGGPMVPVAGFPRPLYPPDASAHGKKPSVDGPDVIAYKRTVSRAGRWPWQPFDDAYSNGFAHGLPPGNVSETGLAGVQRQLGLDPGTGWLGRETFNGLRSIRIPAGLPHAGAPAMDATAQNLIAEAWRLYGGKEPAGDVRERALELAVAELGYVEGSGNRTKFGAWYGADGQPWCAMFTTWAYVLEGSTALLRGSRYAYVPYLVDDAAAHRYGLSLTSSPIAGDLVCYDFDGSAYDHVGLFESGSASAWTAVEGNTSPSSGGSQSNGGGVYRRDRSRAGLSKVAFVRVAS